MLMPVRMLVPLWAIGGVELVRVRGWVGLDFARAEAFAGFRRLDLRCARIHVDIEFDPLDSRPKTAGGMEVIAGDAELAQFGFESCERQTQIDQRSEEHVAADAAEDVEVKRAHGKRE